MSTGSHLRVDEDDNLVRSSTKTKTEKLTGSPASQETTGKEHAEVLGCDVENVADNVEAV